MNRREYRPDDFARTPVPWKRRLEPVLFYAIFGVLMAFEGIGIVTFFRWLL